MAAQDDGRMKETVEAVAAAEESEDFLKSEITLSSGVRLKLQAVSKHYLYAVTSRFPPPEIPLVHLEGKKQPIQNPDDPDYQEAMEVWMTKVANIGNDAALLRGTDVLEIPDGIPGPDDEAWIQEMEVLGLEMIDNPKARYLHWLKGIASPADSDILELLEALGRLTGVSEDDVADAVEKFRSLAIRSSDS